jgi:uncharacterized paraquat-inducible protein A
MKAIGIINIVLGGLYIAMNLLGTLILYIEKIIFSSISNLPYNDFMPFDMGAYMADIFNLMLINLPLALIIYTMLLLGGIKIVKKDEAGIRLTKVSAWSIIAWYLAYMVFAYLTFEPYFEFFAGSGPIMAVIFVIAGIIGFVFTCGYPVFLLLYFRKPRTFR